MVKRSVNMSAVHVEYRVCVECPLHVSGGIAFLIQALFALSGNDVIFIRIVPFYRYGKTAVLGRFNQFHHLFPSCPVWPPGSARRYLLRFAIFIQIYAPIGAGAIQNVPSASNANISSINAIDMILSTVFTVNASL